MQKWRSWSTHCVYKNYYNLLQIPNWTGMNQQQSPGALAVADETEAYQYSFHGHFATINDKGLREEVQGSGHLGSNFVGVASVREGRGMLPCASAVGSLCLGLLFVCEGSRRLSL